MTFIPKSKESDYTEAEAYRPVSLSVVFPFEDDGEVGG
jgi:hypothetical protein